MAATAFDEHHFASDQLLNYRLHGAFDEMFSAEGSGMGGFRSD
jgi:hypothetical protein